MDDGRQQYEQEQQAMGQQQQDPRMAQQYQQQQPQQGMQPQYQQQGQQQQQRPQHQQQQQGQPQAQPPQQGTSPSQTYPTPYAFPNEPGIPQPPHSSGRTIAPSNRIRIHPDHIPSPVAVQEENQRLFNTEPYMTCSRTSAPLATTDFIAIDQGQFLVYSPVSVNALTINAAGNCNPRFLRMTTYNLPHTDDLAVASQLPLGLVVQPFAPLRAEEGTLPVIDFGEVGPPRCDRCRAYINAWCVFIDGGQKFICNLCGGATDGAFLSSLPSLMRQLTE